MSHPAFLSLGLVALLAVGGPLAVIWKTQKRVAETLNSSKPQPEADGLVFNGFPYIRVSADKLKNRRPVSAYEDLVRKQTAEVGPTHPDTLISRNNLANAMLADGRYVEAEALQRELLADMLRTLPEDHPDTFRCQFNLALNLRMQGKLPQARVEMESVYAGCLNVLGETHPRTQEAFLVLENLRQPSSLKDAN